MIRFPNRRPFKRIVVFALLTAHFLQALEPKAAGLLIEEHSSEEHGGGSTSNDILEDSTGTVFLANEAGLLKYDGEVWTKMPATGHASLVTSATIDQNGRIWTTGIGSVGYYESDDHGRYNYKDLTESLSSLPENSDLGMFWEIRNFQGDVFLITSNYVLKRDDEKWKTWTFQDRRRILPSWFGNELYIHDRGNGLFKYSGDQFERIVPDRPEISSGIISIVDHTENGLLCVTVSNGLFWLKDGEFVPARSDIHNVSITHALKLKNGDLALGTVEHGLKILNGAGTIIHQVTINQKAIYKCLESRNGSIWVVGAGKVYEIKNRFLTSLDENTQDIVKTDDRLYYTTGRELKSIPLQNDKAWSPSEVIDQAPSLWDIGLANGEIVYGTASSFRSIDSQGTKLEASSPRPIAFIFRSRVDPDLIYTADAPKVSCWKKRDGHWEMLDTLDDFNSGAVSLIELSDSKLLISDGKGALHLANTPHGAASGGTWKTQYRLGPEHGLPERFIWAHCLRIQNEAIVISNRGLYRYDHETEMLRYDPALGDDLGADAFGLASCPLADGTGWALRLETHNSQGKQANLVGRLLIEREGNFQWRPWNLPALNQAGKVGALLHDVTDGKEVLWVGGSQRLMRYELSGLPRFEPLTTNITAIREHSDQRTYFAGAGTAREFYEWDYPQQSLRIGFAAPSSAIGVEGYQTRLLGFNHDWSEISPNTFSDFTNLHEGDYRFEVRAVDAFGRPGSIRSFQFTIHPPWYRTGYAYAGGCVVLFFFIGGAIRLRSRQLLKRNEELEKIIHERTHKIEQQKLDLERANKAKQHFLASMSHEIRNPLNGIIGIANMMHAREKQSGHPTEQTTHLFTSANHLHQLISQTLDYSSLEAGRLRVRIESFDACRLVDEVIDMHRGMADSKGLELAATKPKRSCHWRGDPVILKQILINLLSNAIKYTDNGSVSLKLSNNTSQDSVLASFEVTDTGPGIPEDKRTYIFEEFTRLSLPGESDIPGTGLGLAIASEMSKLIGGTLSLDQDYSGGACFRLEIELEEDLYAQATSKQINDQSDLLAGRSALVADDLDFNRYINAETLKRLGATVHTAKNGIEALQQLREHSFELAVLDINMPGLTGIEVVQQYLEKCPDKPTTLIALSAYNSPEMETDCLDAGFDHFLEKPLEPLKLIGLLGRFPATGQKPAPNMMDYIANGDPTVLAELEANYKQSLDNGLNALRLAWIKEDVSGQRAIIHKLIGLTCIRNDAELTNALKQLSEAIKQSAPKAEVEMIIHKALKYANPSLKA